MKFKRTSAVLGAVLVLALSGWAAGQDFKQDFPGTWKMCHDGWEGKLIIGTVDANNVMVGSYQGGDGRWHNVWGKIDGYKASFGIDFNDTRNVPDYQDFEGWLFTQSRKALAGTTVYDRKTYGWYAVLESRSTTIPSGPIVSTDTPDPSAGQTATITSARVELTLKTENEIYTRGEQVKFKLTNSGTSPADLHECYYIIEYRQNNVGQEFFTSRREPFDNLTLEAGKTKNWTWNQKDNEGTHSAEAGQWRIKLFTPRISPSSAEPLVAKFKIE